jgi:hypothetical protein
MRPFLPVLTILLMISACQATPAPTSPALPPASGLNPPPSATPTDIANEIRPGTKGQRLELGTVEGEFAIPSDTDGFLLQSESFQTQALIDSRSILDHLTGSNSTTLTTNANSEATPEPITDAQLNHLRATVDDEPVKIEITGVTIEGDEKVVAYRLLEVPADTNLLVEISSPSQGFLISAIIPEVKAQVVNRIDERINIQSTAIALAARQVAQARGASLKELSLAEIKTFANRQEVLRLQERLKLQLRKPDRKQARPQALREVVRAEIASVAAAFESRFGERLRRILRRA